MDGDFKRAHFVCVLILIAARAASGEKCGGLCGKAKREAHYRASLAASEKRRERQTHLHIYIYHPRLFICMQAVVMNSVAARVKK
jgi:hypothetical protein